MISIPLDYLFSCDFVCVTVENLGVSAVASSGFAVVVVVRKTAYLLESGGLFSKVAPNVNEMERLLAAFL